MNPALDPKQLFLELSWRPQFFFLPARVTGLTNSGDNLGAPCGTMVAKMYVAAVIWALHSPLMLPGMPFSLKMSDSNYKVCRRI